MANFNNNRSDRGPRNDSRSFDRPQSDRRNDRRSFDRPQSDRGRGGDSRSYDKPEMHPATCSNCGKSCMVPFFPTGNRPIFCADCFKSEAGTSARRTDDRRSSAPSDRDRMMYDAICDSCGNRCQVPFQPRPGKEVLCSHCFEQKGKDSRNTQDKPLNNAQLDAIHNKLDRILELLSAKPTTSKSAKKDVVEVTKAIETEVTDVTPEITEEIKKPVTKKKAAPKKKVTKKTA